MRNVLGALAALLLTGCGGGASNQAGGVAATQASNEAVPAPSNQAGDLLPASVNAAQGNSAAPAAPAEGWAGHYRGDLDVEVRAGTNPNRYRVEISTTSGGGCMGVVSGAGTANGNRLAFLGVDQENAPGEQCRITLTRRDGGLSIEEGEGCSAFRGVSCSFDGMAARQSR